MKRFLRRPALVEKVGASYPSIYRWELAGNFPKRRRVGPNIVAWDADEVDAWMRSRDIVEKTPATHGVQPATT
jgi:prophage regulatory protein